AVAEDLPEFLLRGQANRTADGTGEQFQVHLLRGRQHGKEEAGGPGQEHPLGDQPPGTAEIPGPAAGGVRRRMVHRLEVDLLIGQESTQAHGPAPQRPESCSDEERSGPMSRPLLQYTDGPVVGAGTSCPFCAAWPKRGRPVTVVADIPAQAW